MQIDRLDHLVLTVADIEATCRFYVAACGMTVETFGAGRMALRFGRQKINLHQVGKEFEPKAIKPTSGSADFLPDHRCAAGRGSPASRGEWHHHRGRNR